MNSSTRRELLEQLQRLSELAPDIRLGQLVASLATTDRPWDETLWEMDDERLLAAAQELAVSLEKRCVPAA
jgi:hypothetical protein